MSDFTKVKQRLLSAGVGPRLHSKTLSDFGQVGQALRDTFKKDSFADICKNGVCVNVYGEEQRVFVFNTYAKESVMSGDSVYLTSMRSLVSALANQTYSSSAEYLKVLDGTKNIFISGFQEAGDCPYTRAERSLVEEYLTSRLHVYQRFTICCDSIVADAAWWSSEFRAQISDAVMEFYVGLKKSKS